MANAGQQWLDEFLKTHKRPGDTSPDGVKSTGTAKNAGQKWLDDFLATHTRPEVKAEISPMEQPVRRVAPSVQEAKHYLEKPDAIANATGERESVGGALVSQYREGVLGQTNYQKEYDYYDSEAKRLEREWQEFTDNMPGGLPSTENQQRLDELKGQYENAVLKRDAAHTRMITSENLATLASWPEADRQLLIQYALNEHEGRSVLDRSSQSATRAATALVELRKKYDMDTIDRLAESYQWHQNEITTKTMREESAKEVEGKAGAAIVHSGLTIPASLAGAVTAPLDYLGQALGRTGQYKTLDPNSAGNLPNVYSSAVRQQVASDIEGDGKSVGRKVASYLYQGGMSALDNGARLLVTGGNPTAAAGLAALGSFGQTVAQASAQGATPAQAIAYGTVAAGIEALTEEIPLDKLVKTAKGGWKGLKPAIISALKQAGVEAMEEEISLIGTTLTEMAILQEKASYNQRIQQLVDEGMSLEEAKSQANYELLGEAIDTAIVSSFSGGLSSTGGSVVAYAGRDTGSAQTAQAGKSTAQLPDNMQDGDTDQQKVQTKPEARWDRTSEPENVSLPTLDDKTGGEVSAETMRRQAQEDYRAGKITEAEFDAIIDEVMHLEELEDGTSVKTFDRQTDVNAQTDNININVNGGTTYGNIQQQPGRPEAAQPAGGFGTQRADIPDGVQIRDAGQGAGIQAGQMASSTRGQGAQANSQAKAIIERQNTAGDLRQRGLISYTSSWAMGIESGTDTENLLVMPEEHYDAEMQQAAQLAKAETGLNIAFTVGNIQINGSRRTGTVRGVHTGQQIIAQCDNAKATAMEIVKHEIFHDKAMKDPGLTQHLKEEIRDRFTPQEFDAVMDRYIDELWQLYGPADETAWEEYEGAYSAILEEMLADAYAGINAFGAGADQFTDAVNERMDQLNMGKIRSQDNGTVEATGPPAERFSVDTINGLEADYGVGVVLDTDIFDGVRPRAWGNVLGKYVYENLAGTELVVHDEQGNQESIYIAKTNDRVRKDGAKNSHKVIDKLARYRGDNIRALATVHLSELLLTSRYENTTSEHSHQWLDENGWEYRKTYIQDRSGNIYEATLNIANGRDRRILYDINNVRLIDKKRAARGVVPSTNNGRGSLAKSSSTERRITGSGGIVKERFSYAGENANNADLDALARAKEMRSAGVADETIRQQTGWHTGMDGKWRWEIDDSGMRYDSSGDLRGAESAKWAMEDYESAKDDLWGHADMDTLEKVRAYNRADIAGDDTTKQELYDELINGQYAYYFDQYVEAMARSKGARNAPAGGTLQDYIDHPALFEAYPHLRNVTLRFERMGGGMMGYYSRTDNEIVLNTELRYAAEDTLVHEIQHAIQKAEGFTRGSNEEYWQRRQDGDDAVHVYDAKIQDSEKKMDEIMRQLPENVAEQFRQWSAMDDSSPEAMAIMQELWDGPYNDLFEDYWFLNFGLDDMRRTNYKRGPRDLYKNTAGEIEARDVTARRSLTPEQRHSQEPARGDSYTVFMEDSDELSLQQGDRYSVDDVDSHGHSLTPEQQRFYAQSQARDNSGRLLVLYHQTDGDFTIFDTRHPGAGSRDSDTPFGIFLKQTAGDIGLAGKKQMALYANITNPLRAANREDLARQLREISGSYADISDKHKQLDAQYHEKFEQAKKAWRDYIIEWRAANPGANRSALNDDPKFNELFDVEDAIVDEWTAAADLLSTQAKEAITEDLRKAGYDGVFLENDVGSWGRRTDAIIALDPQQVKNISNKTPTSNPDIRYSVDDADDQVAIGDLQAELYQLQHQRISLLEADTAYAAAADNLRYANTFTEKVAARKAMAAAAANINTAAIDQRISDLNEQISEIRNRETRKHREDQEKYSGTKTAGYSTMPDTRLKNLDQDYMKAVQSGDRARMAELVEQAAEAAMPASVVRDKSGRLLKTYHHTGNSFTAFDRNMARTGTEMDGFFFAPDPDSTSEYGSNMITAYLNITKLAMDPKLDRKFNDSGTLLREKLAYQGYDGVARTENGEIYEYMTFDPEQIKSADPVVYDDRGRVVPLSERFNFHNPDIRYSVDEETGDLRENMTTKEREILRGVETRLLRNIGGALSVTKFGDRSYLKSVIRGLSDTYLESGTIEQQAMDDLFEQAYHQGIVVDRELHDQYEEVRKYLHTVNLTLDPRDRSDIADYPDFVKRMSGRMRIVNEGGLPVDSAWHELNDMAPELFPDSIAHPADQLKRMTEVLDSLRIAEKSLSDYYGPMASTYKKDAKAEFERAVRESIGELRQIRRFEQERQQKLQEAEPAPTTPEEAMEAWTKLKTARKTYEKAMAKNLLTTEDEIAVGELLKGKILPEHLDKDNLNVKGILAVYEAKQEYEHLTKLLAEYRRKVKADIRTEADTYLETANTWKDKNIGLLYSREIMQRNVEDIVPDKKLAKRINERYFEPVRDAEAAAVKMKEGYREAVRKLKLSRNVAKGNLVSEAHAVQLYGEAMDNIRILEKARGRLKHRDGKSLEEWRGVVYKLWQENPGLDKAKIESAVAEMRRIYDELFQKMNEVRVRWGYEPVNYRQGYFPHFQPGDGDGIMAQFGRVLGIDTQVVALPTTINGLTHTFKPGIQWFGNAQERLGFNTAYDAVEGFDRYIEGVASVICQTENIQRLRALASQIRYRTSDEGIRKQVDAIYSNPTLTEEQKNDAISGIYEKGRYTLSNFVVEVDEYTNLLANKKSKLDRTVEALIGRKFYTAMKWLESRVGANMIAGNVTSALTNFIPLTQASAQLSKKAMLQGMWDTLASYRTDDGIIDRSSFLTNRRGSDPLVKVWSAKVSEVLGKPMELIDSFTSGSIVRAAYHQNLKQGLSENEAMHQADIFASRVMAERSKGGMPTLFESKNPFFKLFTQFQLEVNNQWSEVIKDIPRSQREKGLAALALVFLQYFLGAWLFNNLYEKWIGRRPAMDPIDIVLDTVKDFASDDVSTTDALGNLANNVLEELPFSSALTLIGIETDGGRVPVSSGIPNIPTLVTAATNEDWTPEKRWKEAQDELNKLAYVIPPFGGNQVSKIWKGIKAYIEGGSYSVDSDGNDILQYPVYNDESGDFWGLVQAMLLGKSALPEAKEWVEGGFDSLSAKQTAIYRDMIDAGVSEREAYNLINSLRSASETEDSTKKKAQIDILQGAEATDECKAIAFYGLLATDNERLLMDSLTDSGAMPGPVMDVLIQLRDAAALSSAEEKVAQADILIDSALTESEKEIVIRSWLDDQEVNENGNLTSLGKFNVAMKQGITTEEYLRFRSTGIDINKLLEYTEAGFEADEAQDLAQTLGELEPLPDKRTVSNLQKWRVCVDFSDDVEDQLTALSMLDDMEPKSLAVWETANNYGVAPDVYVTFQEIATQYDTDGNGSYTQAEAKAAIDAKFSHLTTEQKAVLWQWVCYSSTSKKNPYDPKAGQSFIDSRDAAKAAAEEDELEGLTLGNW